MRALAILRCLIPCVALTAVSAGEPQITSRSALHGIAGTAFSAGITASGSPLGFAADGLPPGLAADAASGALSGVPTVSGVFAVTLRASYAGGGEAVRRTILVVDPPDADGERTNYRTGIDLRCDGVKGVDYMEEYLYHDKLVSDRKIVFLRSTTAIRLLHNERNTAHYHNNRCKIIGVDGLDALPSSGDEGIIRYKFDGDLGYGPMWSAKDGSGANLNPAYSGPITLADARYTATASGLAPVLGSTGHNGTPLWPKSAHYEYGQLDGCGDEWHALQIADDDFANPATGGLTKEREEFMCSDGRYHLLVVDPRTPAMTVRATGDAQFYTTPAKTYYLPRIHEQTTSILPRSGTVAFELRDLDGGAVEWRIDDGAWLSAVAPMLVDADFPAGSSLLAYRLASNPGAIRTRRVVKDPPFPSAGEAHGHLYTGNPANYARMLERLEREPYRTWWNRMLTDRDGNWDDLRRRGLRFPYSQASGASPRSAESFSNAFIARVLGADSAPQVTRRSGAPYQLTFADYAKEGLLENCMVLDNVGFEIYLNGNALPNRELILRGYWDVGARIGLARGYDLLMSFYRSDQHPRGITPIEDLYVRDAMGLNAVQMLMFLNGMHGFESYVTSKDNGMWQTSLEAGALISMFAMPSYSTPYYGTCGLDGNTAVYDYTPFIGAPLTWKRIFIDEDAPLTGYPNLNVRFGMEGGLCKTSPPFTYPVPEVTPAPTAWFSDKTDYWSLCCPVFETVLNTMRHHHPAKTYPQTVAAFAAAATNQLYGRIRNGAGSYGPRFHVTLGMLNEGFPSVADPVIERVRSAPASDDFSDDSLMNGALMSALANYDIEYAPGALIAPAIISHPVGGRVAAGGRFVLSVRANGSAPLAYTWTRDGRPLAGATAMDLVIMAATTDDAGAYAATVSNAAGSTVSASATLSVGDEGAVDAAPAATGAGGGCALGGGVAGLASLMLLASTRRRRRS